MVCARACVRMCMFECVRWAPDLKVQEHNASGVGQELGGLILLATHNLLHAFVEQGPLARQRGCDFLHRRFLPFVCRKHLSAFNFFVVDLWVARWAMIRLRALQKNIIIARARSLRQKKAHLRSLKAMGMRRGAGAGSPSSSSENSSSSSSLSLSAAG